MSVRKIALISICSLVGFLTAVSVNHYHRAEKSSKIKAANLFGHSNRNGRNGVSISYHFDEVNANSETAQVTTEISVPLDFKGKLRFKWALGDGVHLVDGTLSGVLEEGLAKGEKKKLSIKVTGFSKETNHHILFEVNGSKDGRNINGRILLASDKESTFEDVVQHVEKIKAEE